LSQNTIISIHEAFRPALHLQDICLSEISNDVILKSEGILEDLPEGVSFHTYKHRLGSLLEGLNCLPTGRNHAAEFEDVVGDVVKLCFFRSLTNVEHRVRDVHGTKIRDW